MLEDHDYHAEKLLPGKVFDRVFQYLDGDTNEGNANGKVDKGAILNYFYKLVEDKDTKGSNANPIGKDKDKKEHELSE